MRNGKDIIRQISASAVLLMAIALPASAQAAPSSYVLRHGHCRPHYQRVVKHVKRHRRGHLARVREVLCVHVKPHAPAPAIPAVVHPAAPASTPQAVTSSVTASGAPSLRASIDPSFVQDPADPLHVTYSYSAGDSTGTLPEGVLQLYSDSLLICSLNVGGAVEGGQCPVEYSSAGVHHVIVTYSSGTNSATESYDEDIEPYSTSTSSSLTPNGCQPEQTQEEPFTKFENLFHSTRSCSYTIAAAIADQQSTTPAGTAAIVFTGPIEASQDGHGTPHPTLGFSSGSSTCTITVLQETGRTNKLGTIEGGQVVTPGPGCTGDEWHIGGEPQPFTTSLVITFTGAPGWSSSSSSSQSWGWTLS